jgi:hypothetical protein
MVPLTGLRPHPAPPRPPLSARRAPHPHRRPPGWLLPGTLAALPGLGYVLGAHLLRDGTIPLYASALCGRPWNQAATARARAWLSQGDGASAARTLARAGVTGTALTTGVTWTGIRLLHWPGSTPAALTFATAQAVLLAMGTVLGTLGDTAPPLRHALLPVAVAAAAALSLPPGPARWVLLTTGLIPGVALSACTIHTESRAHRRHPAAPPPWRACARPATQGMTVTVVILVAALLLPSPAILDLTLAAISSEYFRRRTGRCTGLLGQTATLALLAYSVPMLLHAPAPSPAVTTGLVTLGVLLHQARDARP